MGLKRFKFRLERVLDFRNTVKKEHERKLAAEQGILNVAEDELEGILEASDGAQLPAEEVMTMAELALMGQYQARLREALEEQRELVLEAAEAVEQARDAYIEKAVEAEILEGLRDRRKEEFREEQVKAERKDMREMVVQRHRFTKKGGSNE